LIGNENPYALHTKGGHAFLTDHLYQCYWRFCTRLFPTRLQHLKVLLTGAVLAPGKRTVTAILQIMGRNAAPDFQTYHWVLNRAIWLSLTASQLLLRFVVAVFIPRGVVVLGLDDTIERRRGKQITAKGIYRDPVVDREFKRYFCHSARWSQPRDAAASGANAQTARLIGPDGESRVMSRVTVLGERSHAETGCPSPRSSRVPLTLT
jgi:hypothetical protein